MSFSFLLRAFRGRQSLEPDKESNNTCQHQSFRELGVSRACRRRARSSLDPPSVPDPGARRCPTRSQGVDVLAESPTGSGKTLAFARADRRAHDHGRPTPFRARARADARARLAGDRGLPAARARRKGLDGRVRLRRRADRAPRPTATKKAHILVATPGRLQDLADRRLVDLSRRSHRSCSTRPTGCSTWASSRRSTRSSGACRGTARRCSSRPRSTAEVGELAQRVHEQRVAHRGRALERTSPARSSTGSSRSPADSKVETLVEHIRACGSTLVFVRTKRGADRLVQKLEAATASQPSAMHGDMSQSARERALSRFECGKVATLVATDVAARGARPRRRHARDQLRSAGRGQGATSTAPAAPAARAAAARRSPSCSPSSRPTRAGSRGDWVTTSSSSRRDALGARRSSSTRAAAARRSKW